MRGPWVDDAEGRGGRESRDRKKGIQTPLAHGRSTKIFSIIKWIRTSRLSIKSYLSRDRLRTKLEVALQKRGFRVQGIRSRQVHED